MKWASTISEDETLTRAAEESVRAVRDQLDGLAPDLAVVFLSPHHREIHDALVDLFANPLGGGLLVGCSAGGVIGGGREVENRPGLSLTAAVLPDVELTPLHLETEALPSPEADAEAWESLVGVAAGKSPHFVLLPDPLTFDADRLLRGLDVAFPKSTKVGGLASGGAGAGQHTLILGNETFQSGLVGVAMSGNIAVDTIVAQGCRPIGEPMFVTRCMEHLLFELDGRPAREIVAELYAGLEKRDKDLMLTSLFLGLVMVDARSEYRQGDFLIRNILGADPDSGGLAVGAVLRKNQVVQFHLRDAQTSAEDLDQLLALHERRPAPRGSLLFSCLGRGAHLYGRPDHDSSSFRRHLGEVPLGGFFCNGEIGPVKGTTFLHGYTSSFALFRPRT